MVVAIVPFEALGNPLFAGLTARIAMLGEDLRITLAGQNGTDDGHTGQSSDIRDDMMEEQVHLLQGLLHMLDVGGGPTDQHGALAQVAPQDDDLVGRAKSSLE